MVSIPRIPLSDDSQTSEEPVQLTDAQYSVLRQLADGRVVQYVHPTTRTTLQRRGYITSQRTRGGSPRGVASRKYAITDLGRQVLETCVREPGYTGPSAAMSEPRPTKVVGSPWRSKMSSVGDDE